MRCSGRSRPPAAAATGVVRRHPRDDRGVGRRLSKALRKRGFRFVGPTTMYALMQSAGMVDDHVAGCWRATA